MKMQNAGMIAILLALSLVVSGCAKEIKETEILPVEIVIPEMDEAMLIQEGQLDLELQGKIAQAIKGKSGEYFIEIKDMTTGNFVSINANKEAVPTADGGMTALPTSVVQVKSASIIKMFVANAVYKLVDEGKLDSSKELTLTDAVKCGGTGIIQGHKTGNKYSIDRLVELMLSISDNTASNMLLHEITIEYVNETIKELGCQDTVLGWYFVIPGPKGVRNLTSARDLNLLFEKLYTNTLVSEEYDQRIIEYMKENKNIAKLGKYLPKEAVLAHKTGAINAHEHDGGIIYGPKTDIAITVLTRNGNIGTMQNTAGTVAKIAYEYYNK